MDANHFSLSAFPSCGVSSGWLESLTWSQTGGSNLLLASNGYKLLHALGNSSYKGRAVTQRWVPCSPPLTSFSYTLSTKLWLTSNKLPLCLQAGPIQNISDYLSFLHTYCQSTKVQQRNSEPLGSSDFPRNRLLFWNPRSSNSMRRRGGMAQVSPLSFCFAFCLWTPSRSSNNITKQKALWLIMLGTGII